MSDKLKRQDKEKREALSKFFMQIGEVIKDTYEKLVNNTYPAGNCEQLELFSEELYEETKGVLGEAKANTLSQKLKQAHRVEKLYGELHDGTVDKKELILLDETSGHFIATSKMLLV